jgi:hypothetical protein
MGNAQRCSRTYIWREALQVKNLLAGEEKRKLGGLFGLAQLIAVCLALGRSA